MQKIGDKLLGQMILKKSNIKKNAKKVRKLKFWTIEKNCKMRNRKNQKFEKINKKYKIKILKKMKNQKLVNWKKDNNKK